MSSPYSVLNERPIDQWKVTELREELRKRRLKANGLKEELVKRLDEALRSEMEEAETEQLGNGVDSDSDPENDVDVDKSAAAPSESNADAEPVENQVDEVVGEKSVTPTAETSAIPVEDKSDKVYNDAVMSDNAESSLNANKRSEDQDQKEVRDSSLDRIDENSKNNVVPLESSVSESPVDVGQLESSDQDARYDENNQDSKPSAEDITLTNSEPTNQVSEVSPDLEFQVKSESISTDSVSIIEKNELKNNLNANNANLELDDVKPEMVQPSSSDVPTIGGDSHPLEDAKEMVDNQASLKEAVDVTCAMDMEVCRKIEGVEGGSPEKLNLDRSSGDESMEEDVSESKPIESKNNSEEGERKEGIKEDMAQVANLNLAVVAGSSPEKKGIAIKEEIKPSAAAEKRKAEGTYFYSQYMYSTLIQIQSGYVFLYQWNASFLIR